MKRRRQRASSDVVSLGMQDEGAQAYFSWGFLKFPSEQETGIKDVIMSFSSPVC